MVLFEGSKWLEVFADDSLLFFRATRVDCEEVIQILWVYELAFRQVINLGFDFLLTPA